MPAVPSLSDAEPDFNLGEPGRSIGRPLRGARLSPRPRQPSVIGAVLGALLGGVTIGARVDAIVLGNIVGFAAIGALDLWGLLSGARPVTKVFAVIHLLFAAAFLRAGRASRPREAG